MAGKASISSWIMIMKMKVKVLTFEDTTECFSQSSISTEELQCIQAFKPCEMSNHARKQL